MSDLIEQCDRILELSAKVEEVPVWEKHHDSNLVEFSGRCGDFSPAAAIALKIAYDGLQQMRDGALEDVEGCSGEEFVILMNLHARADTVMKAMSEQFKKEA